MAIEVRMPKLSDNMEEGTIIRWYKQPGEQVTEGEALAEVETDKADVEVEAGDSGILREIRVAEGQTASVGQIIAVLAAPGEAPAAAPPRASGDGRAATDEAPAPPASEPVAAARPLAPPRAQRSLRDAKASSEDGRQHPVRASTVARRMAEDAGVQIGRITGSGPGGLILKRDVEAAVGKEHGQDAGRKPAAAGTEGPAGAGGEGATGVPRGRERVLELSRMRATIARRMAESKREIPHFYVTSEIDMSEAMRLRQTLRETGTIATLTVTHLIVKALAIALTRHPRVNASWRDGGIVLHDEVHVGIAVAVDDGLLVPVLHSVDRLSLPEISAALLALTEKARSGRFSGDDLAGATFSLSNLGTLDIEEIAAVINPPQAAILACGAVKDRPVVRDGAVVAAKTMRATISCDHRVLNGVEAARFLEELKGLLESPVLLVAG